MNKITTKKNLHKETVARYHITPGTEYEAHAIELHPPSAKFVEIQNDQHNRRFVPIGCFVEEDYLESVPASLWKNMPKTKHH